MKVWAKKARFGNRCVSRKTGVANVLFLYRVERLGEIEKREIYRKWNIQLSS